MSDLISRQALCEYALNQKNKSVTPNDIMRFPSAQPEKRTEERTETHACDLIDRQAAIDAADRADYTGLAIEDVKKVTDEVVKELKRLPSAQPEQHWIPCSERLPGKHGEMYLVTISDGAIYSAALQWDINRKRWYLSFLNNGEILIDYIDDVIAWMPLPEPYEAERRTDG